MKPVKSTAEILVYKVLDRNIDKIWVNWAVDMLVAGFNTEHLVILAGESEPFSQFEMQKLVNKVLHELHLDFSDKQQIIKDGMCYLIDKSLKGELDSFKVLEILKDIYFESDDETYLYNDFYSLYKYVSSSEYNAKVELSFSDYQWYWHGATKENIDQIITEYFITWQKNYLANTAA